MELRLEGSYALYSWNLSSQLIALYWVIKCCSQKDWVFSCLEVASGVRMYSLWEGHVGRAFLRTFGGPNNGRFGSLCSRGRSSIPRPGKWRVVLDRSRVSNPWLVFDGVEDLIDRELQWSEAFLRSVISEWTSWEDRECLLLVSTPGVGLESGRV